MKEIIVFERDIEYLKELEREREEMFMTFPEYRTEQVPETWEELKTMCEELEGQTFDVTCDVLKDEIDVTIWNIDRSYKVGFAEFYYNGDTVYLGMGTGFSIPIEIPKVWAFIKSLIGEE